MPSTSAHMMLTLTSLATILKLIGAPLRGILPAAAPATLADMLIDLGHTGSGRSATTHSIITAPIIALIAYMPAAALAYIARPLLETLRLDTMMLLTFMLWGCLYAAALHLLLDSLTCQGIHIPFVGWVNLADLESRGAAANLIPVSLSLLLILLFWMGGGIWTPI
jgi:hypothetical protein